MRDVEIRPPIPFPLVGFDAPRFEPEVEDWRWAMDLEEQLDYDLFARDVAAAHRQRVVGRVRLVAVITFLCATIGVIRLGLDHGAGIALLAAWALPVVVLGVVLAVEKVILRFSR